MKGNAKIIEKLNDLLSDELTAINQYMLHAEMCDNWKYKVLHKVGEKRAIDEMKHAEKLIARILPGWTAGCQQFEEDHDRRGRGEAAQKRSRTGTDGNQVLQ